MLIKDIKLIRGNCMGNEDFLSVKQVAKILKVSPISIYRWLKQTDIPAYRFGKTWRFNADEVIEWAKQRK